jgi:hypothetical protein
MRIKFIEHWDTHQRFNAAITALLLFATGVNAVATIVYVCTYQRASRETGEQTNKIISAANIQASAAAQNAISAQQSAQAASDFAKQAKGINTQTEAAVKQFQRIAGDSEKAIMASAEASRHDQRPWVGLQAVQCNGCTIETDRSLSIQDLAGLIANTGKTPALQMVIDNYVAVNVPKSDPIPDWSSIERQRKEEEERAFRVSPGLPPDVATEVSKSFEKVKRDMAFRKSVSVLPPNGTRVLHFLPSIKIGREPFPNQNEKVTYVIGQITYYDSRRDRQYTTVFCMVNDFGVEFRFCPTGNDMN